MHYTLEFFIDTDFAKNYELVISIINYVYFYILFLLKILFHNKLFDLMAKFKKKNISWIDHEREQHYSLHSYTRIFKRVKWDCRRTFQINKCQYLYKFIYVAAYL